MQSVEAALSRSDVLPEIGRPQDLADTDELSLLHGLPSSYDRTE
jgi:hypothetical protein